MEGKSRRDAIVSILEENKEAITGTILAKKFSVSRQVIVQDIALLRAQGLQIVSTSEGYMVYKVKPNTVKRVFAVKHSTETIEEELNIIVDNGGTVLNVIVTHPVYGEIAVDLMLGTRKSIESFINKQKANGFIPLMSLTSGEHYHTVEAYSEKILDEIEKELDEKGYLMKY